MADPRSWTEGEVAGAKVDAHDVALLVDAAGLVLKGNHPGVQHAVLATLMAMYLGGVRPDARHLSRQMMLALVDNLLPEFDKWKR